jgi:ubiquinone/menaquinone biosynthesis C-methylase UbiE
MDSTIEQRQPQSFEKSLKQQQERYDKTWRNGLAKGKEQRGNLQTNLDFLAKTNLLKPTDKILEIGCGIGSVVFELSKQGYDITGTDISQEAIAYGLKKYGNIKLQVQPAEILQFEDQAFNIVMSFDLFEHIAQVDRHITEVYRVLRPGGYYLFQTPNKYSNTIFETFKSKSFKWRHAHPSLHTPRQLKKRLAKYGFESQFVKMNPINEFTIKKLQRFGPIGRIFKHINFRRLPLSLQTNLYIVAKKIKLINS